MLPTVHLATTWGGGGYPRCEAARVAQPSSPTTRFSLVQRLFFLPLLSVTRVLFLHYRCLDLAAACMEWWGSILSQELWGGAVNMKLLSEWARLISVSISDWRLSDEEPTVLCTVLLSKSARWSMYSCDIATSEMRNLSPQDRSRGFLTKREYTNTTYQIYNTMIKVKVRLLQLRFKFYKSM
jgi:hypothetical protein